MSGLSKLVDIAISIHAPLTGSDSTLESLHFFAVYFNPRSPYGERLPIQEQTG